LEKQKARLLARMRRPIPAPKPPSRPAQIEDLSQVREWLGDCQRCPLSQGRKQIVFGRGNPNAKLMFIAEAPRAEEEIEEDPLVGKAGQLLAKIIEAMGMKPSDCYLTNIVKCRTPANRDPNPEEMAQCDPFLKAQIDAIGPQVIVALGIHAATALTGSSSAMSNLRGRFHKLVGNNAMMVMPTYHPAYLLRNPNAKRLVWEDMKLVIAKLEGHS
jgi:DNA polymerase